MRTRIALLLIATSATVAAAQNAPSPSVAERIAEQRRALSLDASGRFGGAAWDALVADAASAQFTMVGEQHGMADAARLAIQLENQLIDRGYTHAALEISPLAANYAERLLRTGGAPALEAYLSRPGNGFVFPFISMRDELPMAATIVARSPDRKAALWGVDQEFAGSGAMIVELFARRARTRAQRAALDRFASTVKGPEGIARMESAQIEPLAAAFSGDAVAESYVAALRKTMSIYDPFVRRKGSGYAANLERETLMKDIHSLTNVPSFTNYLAEWGHSRGYRVVNLAVDCAGGQMLTPGGAVECEPIIGPNTALGAVIGNDRAAIVDLRPLRRYAAMKDLDADSRQIILAFDYYVKIRDVAASTFVNRPKP